MFARGKVFPLEAKRLKLCTQFIYGVARHVGTVLLPLNKFYAGMKERLLFHEVPLLVAPLDACCYSATATGIKRPEMENTYFLRIYKFFVNVRLLRLNDALQLCVRLQNFSTFSLLLNTNHTNTLTLSTKWVLKNIVFFSSFSFGFDFMHAVCLWRVICSFTTILPSKILSH